MIALLVLVAIGFAIEVLAAIALLGTAIVEEAPDRVFLGCLAVIMFGIAGFVAAVLRASSIAEARRLARWRAANAGAIVGGW